MHLRYERAPSGGYIQFIQTASYTWVQRSKSTQEELLQAQAFFRGDSKPAPASSPAAPRSSPTYTAAMITETVEICSLAGVSTLRAREFVNAKMPVAKVRSILAGDRAEADNIAAAKSRAVRADWDSAVTRLNSMHGISTERPANSSAL